MQTDLIYNRAWSFHRTTGIELQDLISQATLIYLEAEKEFDPNKGISFVTFVHTCLDQALIDYCEKTKKLKIIDLKGHNLDWLQTTFVETNISFTLNMSRFSGDVKEVVLFVLKQQEDFDLNYSRKNRGLIAQRLLEQGWKKPRIWLAFKALHKLLKTIPQNELFS